IRPGRCELSKAIIFAALLLFSCQNVNAQANSGKIIFVDEFSRLLLINADGTGQTPLTEGVFIRDGNPVYSPDGSKIAFDRTILGKTHIYIMNADGTNPVAVTSDGPLPNASFHQYPTWSPDGTRLAFMSDRDGTRKCEIWVININGSGLTKLTTNIQVGTDSFGPVFGWDQNPRWSPDGSRIAFDSMRHGLSNRELYVMNADGSNQTRLTDNIVEDRFPSWSPDSQRIAFRRGGSFTHGINIINRDGTNPVHVTIDGDAPVWSPDGLKFVTTGLDPNISFKPALFILNVDGTNKVKLTNNNFSSFSPAWAPTSSTPIPTSTISGFVRDGNGAPISGATLTLTQPFNPRITQSDAAGAYSFPGLPVDNYRIDIVKSGFGFVPASVNFSQLNTDQTANFTAFVAFSISGQVNGIDGDIRVTLSGSENRQVLTGSNGSYSFDILPAGGNYTVFVNNPIWNVTPAGFTFNNLSENQIANFNAVRATYTISGTITRLGQPKPGIEVRLENGSGSAPPTRITDENGRYSFSNVLAGVDYVVRPVGANYLMDPQTRDFNRLDGNKTADFVALSVNQLLFSKATFAIVEGTPNLIVTVVRGGNATGVGPITVQYTTADGTATAGLDYSGTTGTLNFADGIFSQTITIPIVDDQNREGTEQFSISLSNPTGEVDLGTLSTATLTIVDNDTRVLTEDDSDRAIVLSNPLLVTGPFSLTTSPNFSTDPRTRISLFVEGLEFNQGVQLPPISVQAVDIQQNQFQLPLEAIAFYTTLPFSQIIVRLPGNLSPGDLMLTVTVNGQPSNSARISIKP
ncbi:MAG TPA: carboxypeptidase regulatory-like domain-containing protein, partial [Pyrinomonadaceae bacterium]|nr:carboxypeptidase regulatory-like domain-containing protein [Pyrinomonadaceae bacterium]